jgi:hypothetical protein
MLLGVFVPAHIARENYFKGPIPEKQIELTTITDIDPVRRLSSLGSKVTLTFRIGEQTFDNLVIAKAWLHNIDESPVLPADFHQNISVNVKEPWKILAVEDTGASRRGAQFKWKKINDTKFEAEPTLINPGDRISAEIYLTNTLFKQSPTTEQQPEPNVEWRARIVQMRGFTEKPPNSWLEKSQNRYWGIYIELSGWGVPFTIVTAMLFQAIYLYWSSRAGFLRTMHNPKILLVLGASLLSFACAESMATYLFGNTVSDILGVPHWWNVPWIVLYWVALALLYRRAKPKTT